MVADIQYLTDPKQEEQSLGSSEIAQPKWQNMWIEIYHRQRDDFR
ncbi:protein of unknown function [Candidatus Nitrosacidococcus tergens]|uniref:Uncharacterized protein n=1 Tax=Candidatus Nitrosacidococcus tergens TaxID=553981 RepID=A0A7G1Q8F1_9GAMM|nr:protein of unknown function [Candidatus Nitrosacidococcus tergens]